MARPDVSRKACDPPRRCLMAWWTLGVAQASAELRIRFGRCVVKSWSGRTRFAGKPARVSRRRNETTSGVSAQRDGRALSGRCAELPLGEAAANGVKGRTMNNVVMRNTDGSTEGADPRTPAPKDLRDVGHDNTPLLQDDAGPSFCKHVAIVEVYEFRRRGAFFAFAYGPNVCACGALRMLVPLRLRISRQPFVDMARSLRAAGYDSSVAIGMVHDGGGSAALSSTIDVAAGLRVTNSRFGTPVFARHQAKVLHGSDRDAICRAGTRGAANENNAPAGPVLHLPAKRAA